MNFTDDQLKELLPLVALGMASPEELQAVTAALEVDALLRAEYGQVQRALSGIPAAVAPPPALKARLLEAIRQPEAARLEPRPVPSHAPRASSRTRGVPRRALWGGLAAGAVIALALGRPTASNDQSEVNIRCNHHRRRRSVRRHVWRV